MPYFDSFPTISYDVTGDKNFKTIRDITTRIRFKSAIQNNTALFAKYDVKDGETPEAIAYREYGEANLHWIVLVFNDILDPRYDWPLSQRDLNKFVKEKYTDPDGEHHREIAQSSGVTSILIRVESDVMGAAAVTNFEYEENVNVKKAQIRLLKSEFVGQIIKEFRSEMGING
tara:strand:+ start:32 stop:550 length:519 start_codon:yes stop_codon:yes gene_type:complete